MVLYFVACHTHIINLINPLFAPPNPINMTDIIHSYLLSPVYTSPSITSSVVYSLDSLVKETPHFILDTSKNTTGIIPSREFLSTTRQILKSSVINASKYKVQDPTEVILKKIGFSGFI